jgi:NADPH:quinone reductase-like Zn-dependent oxidoreductase
VARAAGADLIVNRRHEDVAATVMQATGKAGVDRIVDVDLVSNIEIDMGCLAPSGVASAYATDDPGARLSVPFLKAMFQGFVFRYVFVYTMPEEARRLAIRDVTACLAAGAYRPAIGLRVPLAGIAEAHEAQESGGVIGKTLIDIGA